MRGPDDQTSHMFSYLSPEQRVRADHPLRAIRAMTDRVFATLSPRFTKMYSDVGRPAIGVVRPSSEFRRFAAGCQWRYPRRRVSASDVRKELDRGQEVGQDPSDTKSR